MPIDARIPLGVEVPEAPSALEAYGRVMQLRQMRDLGREREARARKLEEDEAEERAIRQVFTRNVNPDGTINHRATLSELWKIAPQFADKYANEVREQEKREAEQVAAKQKQAIERRGRFAQRLVDVKSKEDLDARLAQAVVDGDMTEEEAARWYRLPWTPDTQNLIKQTRQMVLDVGKQDEAERAAKVEARAAEDQEIQRKAEARAAQVAAWAAEKHPLDMLQARANVNRTFLDIYGGKPLTPVQEDVIAHRAATRAETAQHHRAIEGTATAREARQAAGAARTGGLTLPQREALLKREAELHIDRERIGNQLKHKQDLKGEGLSNEAYELLKNEFRIKTNELDELTKLKIRLGLTTEEDTRRPPDVQPETERPWYSIGGFGAPKAQAAPPAAAPPRAAPAPTGRLTPEEEWKRFKQGR